MSSSRPDRAAVPPALLDPEPTADRRIRRHNEAVARGWRPPRTAPGLDVEALRAKYGGDPANALQTITGVFRVPLGATWDQYRRIRDRRLSVFLRVLEAKGYRLVPRKGALRVGPGLYPASHPETGAPLPDQREFRVEVDCSYPRAEPVVVRLDPADVAPTTPSKEG